MIRHFWLPKLIALAIALSFVLTLSGVGVATTYAASHTHTLSQSTTPKSGSPNKPLCSGLSLTSSPTSLTAYANAQIAITVTIHCPPGNVGIIMDWRDGTSNSQGCNPCTDGSTLTFYHSYQWGGETYIAKAYHDIDPSVAVWISCNIT